MNGRELDPQQRPQFIHPAAAYGQHLADRGDPSSLPTRHPRAIAAHRPDPDSQCTIDGSGRTAAKGAGPRRFLAAQHAGSASNGKF